MNIALVSASRFHFEKLLLQLCFYDHSVLWITGLPRSRFPKNVHPCISSRPLGLVLYLYAPKPFKVFPSLRPKLENFGNIIFDIDASRSLSKINPDILIGISHHISRSGLLMRSRKKIFICDVPIAHPRLVDRINTVEYKKLGIDYYRQTEHSISREESAIDCANHIVCPSTFVQQSLAHYHGNSILRKSTVINFGSSHVSCSRSSLPRFAHKDQSGQFTVLFVGQVIPRKGIQYLLEAFKNLSHPSKKLIIAGPLLKVSGQILNRYDLSDVEVKGICSKAELHKLYLEASVFVLPSLAEGQALVLGEALSYGLPIIATYESGASELGASALVTIIQSGSAVALKEALEAAVSLPLSDFSNRFSQDHPNAISDWDTYGYNWNKLLQSDLHA